MAAIMDWKELVAPTAGHVLVVLPRITQLVGWPTIAGWPPNWRAADLADWVLPVELFVSASGTMALCPAAFSDETVIPSCACAAVALKNKIKNGFMRCAYSLRKE